jgi:hypothetical protein
MIHKMPPDKTTRNIDRAPVSVNMIRSILRIVFKYKYHRLFPYRTPAKIFYKFPYRQVIIRHMRKWTWLPLFQAFRMIVPQPYRIEPWQGPHR